MTDFDTGTALLSERVSHLDTCALSDALDRLGLPGAIAGIGPMVTVERPVAGRVVTVDVVDRRDNMPRPHLGAQAIASAFPGDVIVVDHKGRLDVSAWGGLLSLAASKRGVRGVIVDGACRDIHEARSLGFPVFARAVVPVTARGRVVEQSWGDPVLIAGVRVATGDLVIADSNGIVFMEAANAEAVVTLAEQIASREAAMADAVIAGQSIVDVMHDNRFTEVK